MTADERRQEQPVAAVEFAPKVDIDDCQRVFLPGQAIQGVLGTPGAVDHEIPLREVLSNRENDAFFVVNDEDASHDERSSQGPRLPGPRPKSLKTRERGKKPSKNRSEIETRVYDLETAMSHLLIF